MSYLCLHVDQSQQLTALEVTDPASCNAYIADLASNSGLAQLSIADANELIGAVSVLFAVAFVLRAVIHFIQNRF